jgi:hypothetical protein
MMARLAGQLCGVCQLPIGGVITGARCPRCEVPVHKDCLPASPASTAPGTCPDCGTPSGRRDVWIDRERSAGLAAIASDGMDESRAGFFMIATGIGYIAAAAFFQLLFVPGLFLVPLLFLIGGYRLVRGRMLARAARRAAAADRSSRDRGGE